MARKPVKPTEVIETDAPASTPLGTGASTPLGTGKISLGAPSVPEALAPSRVACIVADGNTVDDGRRRYGPGESVELAPEQADLLARAGIVRRHGQD